MIIDFKISELSTHCYFGICPVTDSSSDYSQRTGIDVPSLQLEIRTTPEGARIDTDDPLQDRIKVKPLIVNLVRTARFYQTSHFDM